MQQPYPSLHVRLALVSMLNCVHGSFVFVSSRELLRAVVSHVRSLVGISKGNAGGGSHGV